MDRVKDNINDEIARRMMQQREFQLAVRIAQARDTIWYFGSAWSLLVSGVTVAHIAGRKPPAVAGVPIVIGALVLGNLADMAYGTKMMRVVKEAEHILEHERGRLVPFQQVCALGRVKLVVSHQLPLGTISQVLHESRESCVL